jgi:hypothetical protein
MISKAMLWLIVAGGLPLVPFARSAPRSSVKIAPVPGDPLELATGQIQVADAVSRDAILQLLDRARSSYTLRNARQGYDLKISFVTDTLGKTAYDGDWELEDTFIPGQGLHWNAQAAAGYAVTGISSNGELYGEGMDSAIPLRLEEVRGILLHPLPSASYASRESIRTSVANLNGLLVTCVLLSDSKKPLFPAVGRAWEESEECIDPQSGLLLMHSEAPGRYAVYDYSNAPQLGSYMLPRTITVTEAGRIVSKISIEKLTAIATADPSLFVPRESMKAKGRSIEMTATTKLSRVHAPGRVTSAMTMRPVCVLGVVTPTGQLAEAHSLQPSDPNSQAAVEDAQQIDFSKLEPAGGSPRQHFVFVIEKFVSP